MLPTILLAPSILAADFARLGEETREVVAAGADWIHVDVMDGHFVPNISLGPGIVQALRRSTQAPLDVHLMIAHPEQYLAAFAAAGADHLIVHVETCPHLHRTLEQIRELGKRPGVALNPATPVSALSEVLDLVDIVLVMTVNPGFGGQTFIPHTLRKIAQARAALDALGSGAALTVDGGIDRRNARAVVKAGARVLVAGSAVFRGGPAGHAAENLKALRAEIAP